MPRKAPLSSYISTIAVVIYLLVIAGREPALATCSATFSPSATDGPHPKNCRLARANGCFSDQSVASIADFSHQITATKARARAARASQREVQSGTNTVSPQFKAARTSSACSLKDSLDQPTGSVTTHSAHGHADLREAPRHHPRDFFLTNPPTLLILAAAHYGEAPRESRTQVKLKQDNSTGQTRESDYKREKKLRIHLRERRSLKREDREFISTIRRTLKLGLETTSN